MSKLNKSIFFFLLGVLAFNFLYAQQNSKRTDSLYKDYFITTSIDLKVAKCPKVISALSNARDSKRAYEIFADMEKLKVEPLKANFKKGIILLTKGLFTRAIDSVFISSFYARQAMHLLANNLYYLSEAQSLLVMNFNFKGQFDSCIVYGNKFMSNMKKSNNISGQLELLIVMSSSYDFLGDRHKAIELAFEAIELAKEQKEYDKLAEIYVSLASTYKDENLELAKKYALLSLEIFNNKKAVKTSKSSTYLVLGNIYYDAQEMDSAKYYYDLCKENSLKINDVRMYLAAVGNLGNIAIDQKDFKLALLYNKVTLNEYKKIRIPAEIAVSYGSLADLYKDMKEYTMAVKYYDSALVITEQIQSADDFIYNYKGLSETYEAMNNHKEALKYYKLYRLWNDSVNNNQNSKKISEMQLNFKYKAEQREKDLMQKSKDLISQEKIKQQKYIIWASVLGALCLVIFLGFTIKSNIQKKKTNKQLQVFNNEISEQKNIIEEKNNEITDSITYASRIQQGVIPDEEELKELLPQHFVFFKPRDIVSGDFYWASKVSSKTNLDAKRSVVAVVDCTGHGVPGAFMSLVGNTLLNQTIGRPNIETPAQALDYINAQLPKTIKSKSSTGIIKDGMEIAMCEFNFDTLTMQFAGANSNIYLVRNGVIQIFKGDKQPIGESFSGNIINYTNHIISLQKNDCVYLISDGYADQFGGDKGKKFKYKPLENLFCTIADKDVIEQRAILAKAFDDWKSHHEQVDDVLIMGIKI